MLPIVRQLLLWYSGNLKDMETNGNGEASNNGGLAIMNDNNGARLAVMELTNMVSVPMSLTAIVKLKVADAIWDDGSNIPLSASEILAKIRPCGGGGASNLQRVLRMLTSYGVFHEHFVHDTSERRYSLTEVGKILVTDEKGLSFGCFVVQRHQDELMKAWAMVDEVVNDASTEPFVKLFGEFPYTYYAKKPGMTCLMINAMSAVSVPFMKTILESYNGFEGVKTLVDVGGSGGDCLKMILDKHPGIEQGINFDLPDVVEKAPIIPRVKHVGGDMLKYIPMGDTIFMKWVLDTWTDEECKVIMKNCYNSVAEGGKFILCQPVLPHHTDGSRRTRALLQGDIFAMTVHGATGKYRTEDEYRKLALSAGFAKCRAFYIDHYFTILEFQKS